ncbi:hypothetical protein [Actinomadura geliboluensis]|uniref:hypothetical protein n=1 Tax=Actinomadura geliboluensis TaxID=882440 RepID=UPI0037148ECE
MTELATHHLTHLQHQLHTTHLDHDLHQPAIPPELARLTHVLARYHHQIADGFGTPHPATTGMRDAAHRAGTLLQQAEHVLGPPADTPTPPTDLANTLRAASTALGCGLDLLSTHFPTSTDQPASPNAPVIAAPQTARSLLHQLSTHTATIGHLAYRTGTPTDQAGPLLLKAAFLARIHSDGQTPPPPLTAVPLHHTRDRIPPVIGEDHDQTIAGIDASVHRLSNPTDTTSITTWRYLARTAAILCHLNTKTLHQLILRLHELNQPDHIPVLKQAKADIHRLNRSWQSIIRRWDTKIGHYGHPANGPATDAGDLILRIGRLLHEDPAWTPSPRASSRVKPPHELAPTLPQAAQLLTATIKTIDACTALAAHHHAAINDAAAIASLERKKKYPTRHPRVLGSALELSTRYDIAHTKGRRTITTLAQAIQTLIAPAPIPEDIELLVHRTGINNEHTQPELAATDFPTPITDCLNVQQNQHENNPATHISPTLPQTTHRHPTF